MLVLYDAARCPYCARVRIVLAEKGVSVEAVAIDLDDRPGWIYELKWDGYRAIADVGGRGVRLYSRNHKSFEERFAPIVESLRGLGRRYACRPRTRRIE